MELDKLSRKQRNKYLFTLDEWINLSAEKKNCNTNILMYTNNLCLCYADCRRCKVDREYMPLLGLEQIMDGGFDSIRKKQNKEM